MTDVQQVSNAVFIVSTTVTADVVARALETDDELHNILRSESALELRRVPISVSDTIIYCDVAHHRTRPFVPQALRSRVFDAVHNLTPEDEGVGETGVRPVRVARLQEDRASVPSLPNGEGHAPREHTAGEFSTRTPQHHRTIAIGGGRWGGTTTAASRLSTVLSKWTGAFPKGDITAESVAVTFFRG